MIGYKISPKELRKLIGEKWLIKALAASKRSSGKQKLKSIWSEVKPVFMKIQHGKCAFCESLLGKQIAFDLINQDVEHFRPKNGVEAWPTEKLKDKLKLPTDLPESKHNARGYTFLAYHELNYSVACKTCNSTLKANHFPTIKKPNSSGKNPCLLNTKEQPYLVNPVGDYDVKPEDLIGFLGLIPVPLTADPALNSRARVIIAFFGLSIREDLLYGRALLLDQIGDKFKLLHGAASKAEKDLLNKEIDELCAAHTPHANCAGSFARLWRTKPAKAKEILKIVKDFLVTYGKKVLST